MRRIDHFTLEFFARSLQANRLLDDLAPTLRCSEEGDRAEEQIQSWESAWIDLGGEG